MLLVFTLSGARPPRGWPCTRPCPGWLWPSFRFWFWSFTFVWLCCLLPRAADSAGSPSKTFLDFLSLEAGFSDLFIHVHVGSQLLEAVDPDALHPYPCHCGLFCLAFGLETGFLSLFLVLVKMRTYSLNCATEFQPCYLFLWVNFEFKCCGKQDWNSSHNRLVVLE